MICFLQAISSYQYDSVMTRLLNQLSFYIMPVFNVDGYQYSWNTVPHALYISNISSKEFRFYLVSLKYFDTQNVSDLDNKNMSLPPQQ